MKRLLKFNICISGSIYFILFIVVYQTIISTNKLMSIYAVIPYITSITFAFIYRNALYNNYNSFRNSLLLQSSLPVRKEDIIKSNYVFTYIEIIVISGINYLPGIFFRMAIYQRMDTFENFIMVTLLIILSYNITTPSIIHSVSTKNTIITTIIVLLFYGLCIVSTLVIKYSPLPIIYINVVLLLCIIFTYSLSIKKSIYRLSIKFE